MRCTTVTVGVPDVRVVLHGVVARGDGEAEALQPRALLARRTRPLHIRLYEDRGQIIIELGVNYRLSFVDSVR